MAGGYHVIQHRYRIFPWSQVGLFVGTILEANGFNSGVLRYPYWLRALLRSGPWRTTAVRNRVSSGPSLAGKKCARSTRAWAVGWHQPIPASRLWAQGGAMVGCPGNPSCGWDFGVPPKAARQPRVPAGFPLLSCDRLSWRKLQNLLAVSRNIIIIGVWKIPRKLILLLHILQGVD